MDCSPSAELCLHACGMAMAALGVLHHVLLCVDICRPCAAAACRLATVM
jgi:hypothetical protein